MQGGGLFGTDLPKFVVAVGAAETADMKHLLVGQETFHGVHGLLTPHTDLFCRSLKLLEKEAGQFEQSTVMTGHSAEMDLGFNLSKGHSRRHYPCSGSRGLLVRIGRLS